jgi:hypothetical protein
MMNCLSEPSSSKAPEITALLAHLLHDATTDFFFGTARNQFNQQLASILRVSCAHENLSFSHDESNFISRDEAA